MPKQPANGYIQSAAGSDKLVQYKCNPGYKIVGATYNYCVDGMWTALTPKCAFQYTGELADEKPLRVSLYKPSKSIFFREHHT